MRLNRATVSQPIYTAEGARAVKVTPIEQLSRLVLVSLLWEDSFYIDGKTVAQSIAELIPQCHQKDVASLAIKARREQHLRHMPLLLVREMARVHSSAVSFRRQRFDGLVADTLFNVIERVDEIAEFLAIYWKDGKTPLSAQVKKGLAAAFNKFNAYQFAKYDRDHDIKLRDVAFLAHPKPIDRERAEIFARLFNKDHYPKNIKHGLGLGEFQKLAAADTWENRLSAGASDKKTMWSDLLMDDKLGALALIRNLRNMTEAGVPESLIRMALVKAKTERVLPFRFISAAKYAPQLEDALEDMMFRCLEGVPKLKGKTTLVVDNSGSMYGTKVSQRSELDRAEAAAALAMLLREVCEQVEVIVFSDVAVHVRPRRGFALRDQIQGATSHSSTNTSLAKSLADVNGYDRIIILTDEQSHTTITGPQGLGYVINVANEKNGIGYGAWHHIDGWSEAVVSYITELEQGLGL